MQGAAAPCLGSEAVAFGPQFPPPLAAYGGVKNHLTANLIDASIRILYIRGPLQVPDDV